MAIKKISALVGRKKAPEDAQTLDAEPAADEAQPLTVTRIAALMQAMGYRGRVIEGDDWCWAESAANGVIFSIYAFSDNLADPDSAARSLQFDGGWGGLSAYDARRLILVCNHFNHDWRFAKATVAMDKDQHCLNVKMDHVCPNGLSDEEFFGIAGTYIRLFEDMARRAVATGQDGLTAILARHNEAVGLMWGAESSPDQAVSIYLDNARAGYGGSMSSLGDLYEHGAVVGPSDVAATYFFAQAAERGQPSAYFGLARLLSAGAPDDAILIEAAKFAILAVRDLPDGQSKRKAEILRDDLMRKLDDEAQNTAMSLAGSWMPLRYEGGPIENGPIHDSAQMPPSSALN